MIMVVARQTLATAKGCRCGRREPAAVMGEILLGTTPVLSDPTLQVSRSYNANRYGMMGYTRDGHTFILVGPDGIIRWRSDYGAAPDYIMFLPTEKC
jgi:hypothetical protein